MHILLTVGRFIDALLTFIAKVGMWLGFILVVVVGYDVVTRYFGVPKAFGLNSTQIQESEYWLHAFLIVLTVGYAYLRQAHVRIDLVRDMIPKKGKYFIEIFGLIVFLIPYAILGIYLSIPYTEQSFLQNEISKSQIGFSNIWILKGGIVILYVLIGLAGISQLFKSIAGLAGRLTKKEEAELLGGGY
jgi:TRAP-type mannitol/chloroaromatic compound transport system permease small subunit